MQLNHNSFSHSNAEFWLIILTYAVFWSFSYYSLIILLIHTRQQNSSIKKSESLDITDRSPMLQKL